MSHLTNKYDYIGLWVVIILIIMSIAFFIGLVNNTLGFKNGYKQGQIDMMLGKSKYVLMEKQDSTRYWKEVSPHKIYCTTTTPEQSWYYWPSENYGLVKN